VHGIHGRKNGWACGFSGKKEIEVNNLWSKKL